MELPGNAWSSSPRCASILAFPPLPPISGLEADRVYNLNAWFEKKDPKKDRVERSGLVSLPFQCA